MAYNTNSMNSIYKQAFEGHINRPYMLTSSQVREQVREIAKGFRSVLSEDDVKYITDCADWNANTYTDMITILPNTDKYGIFAVKAGIDKYCFIITNNYTEMLKAMMRAQQKRA